VLQEGSQIPTQYGIALDKVLNLKRIVQDERITPTMKVFYFQELVKVSLQVGIPPEKEDLWSQAEQRLRDLRKERLTTIGLQTSVPLSQAPTVEHPLSRKWNGSYNLPLPLMRANLVDKRT
jgi:hypothetical protein